MIAWQIHHRLETVSTNLDARVGSSGDVFTADFQTAGRGRLDHKWLSPPKTNLTMSVVLSVAGLNPEHVVTLPLVVGLSVCEGVDAVLDSTLRTSLKWPNDVVVDGRKLSGILCERHGDNVIAGIGVNVRQREFAPEIASRATSLALLRRSRPPSPEEVRDSVLAAMAQRYEQWREKGLDCVFPDIADRDCLRGFEVSVLATDKDEQPITGRCGGIRRDGALDVAGVAVFAGEAHILAIH